MYKVNYVSRTPSGRPAAGFEAHSGRMQSAVPNEANTPKTLEVDPNGVPAHLPGAKLDKGKIPVMRGALQYFPRALKAVAEVSLAGATKYSWKGWEKVEDGVNRYGDALGRHIIAEETEGEYDDQLAKEGWQILHAAQIAWNALARLELILREKETQNIDNQFKDISDFYKQSQQNISITNAVPHC